MIGIATSQELRDNLGDVTVKGRSCTAWIDWSIDHIENFFMKPECEALMENVGTHGRSSTTSTAGS